MKRFILILLLLAITGCSDDAENGENSGGQGGENQSLTWGDLKCQKKKSCANPILNLELENLDSFISLQFPSDSSSQSDTDSGHFFCGQLFMQNWMHHFPQHQGAKKEEIAEIANFGRHTINIKQCTNHPEVSEKINNYFINTKEYKNAN